MLEMDSERISFCIPFHPPAQPVFVVALEIVMNPKHPTIAFSIGMSNAIDGPAHYVYTQAYGMEMQVDDEWPLNILIMAPPHLVSSLTQEADVASMGMIPGASYTPGDGDYHQISMAGGRWVLARPSDDLTKIIEQKLGVLLLVDKRRCLFVGELDLRSQTSGHFPVEG